MQNDEGKSPSSKASTAEEEHSKSTDTHTPSSPKKDEESANIKDPSQETNASQQPSTKEASSTKQTPEKEQASDKEEVSEKEETSKKEEDTPKKEAVSARDDDSSARDDDSSARDDDSSEKDEKSSENAVLSDDASLEKDDASEKEEPKSSDKDAQKVEQKDKSVSDFVDNLEEMMDVSLSKEKETKSKDMLPSVEVSVEEAREESEEVRLKRAERRGPGFTTDDLSPFEFDARQTGKRLEYAEGVSAEYGRVKWSKSASKVFSSEEIYDILQDPEDGVLLLRHRSMRKIFHGMLDNDNKQVPDGSTVWWLDTEELMKHLAKVEPDTFEELSSLELPEKMIVMEQFSKRETEREPSDWIFRHFWSSCVVGDLMAQWEELAIEPTEFIDQIGSGLFQRISQSYTEARYFFNPNDQREVVRNIVAWWSMFGVFAPVMRKKNFRDIDEVKLSAWLKEKGLNIEAAVRRHQPEVDIHIPVHLISNSVDLRLVMQSPTKGVFLFHQRSRRRIFLNRMGLHRMQAPPDTPVVRMRGENFRRILFEEDPELAITIANVELPEYIYILELLPNRFLRRAHPNHVFWRYWSWLTVGYLLTQFDALEIKADEVRREIGHSAFEEIRIFLERERYLFDPSDDEEVVAQFVCWWAMLGQFAPQQRRAQFPSVEESQFDIWVKKQGLNIKKAMRESRPNVYNEIPVQLDPPEAESLPKWEAPSWLRFLSEEDGESARKKCVAISQDQYRNHDQQTEKETNRPFVFEFSWLLLTSFVWWLRARLWGQFVSSLPGCFEGATWLKKLTARHAKGIQIFEFSHHLYWALREKRRGNAVEAAVQFTEALNFYRVFANPDDPLFTRLKREIKDHLGDVHEHFVETHGIKSAKHQQALREMLTQLIATPLSEHVGRQAAAILKVFQRSYLDKERQFFTTRLMRWLFSFGKQPIQLKLQRHGLVRSLRYLQSTHQKLSLLPLSDEVQTQWEDALHAALEHLEDELREEFRPELMEAMSAAGFHAITHPERVALAKICEELIDFVVHRGLFTFSDVRDVISRNDLRLNDQTVRDFVAGDQLLHLNKELASRFGEIYRAGEVYLRMLQRSTSVAFGTKTGRWICLYILVPYLGAAILLEGLNHMVVHPIAHAVGAHDVGIFSARAVLAVGSIMFLIIHTETGWTIFKQILSALWSGIRFLFQEAPRWFVKQPEVQKLLSHPRALPLYNQIVLPLVLSSIFATISKIFLALLSYIGFLMLRAMGTIGWTWLSTEWTSVKAVIVSMYSVNSVKWLELLVFWFIVGYFFVNVTVGRAIWDWVAYRLLALWYKVRDQWVIGLFRWILDFFHSMLLALDYVIYRVDDLLRFHQGENQVVIVLKAVAQVIWGTITYIIRFFVNLVAEPQLNPLKHFPVVTVSHKLIIPVALAVATGMKNAGYSVTSMTVVGLIFQFGIPGICGFLVWEFKENWKQFRANQPKEPVPVRVGSHGETMNALLRRGFHSGTLPKLYDKLYKQYQREYVFPDHKKIHKLYAELHHVSEAIEIFIRRELLAGIRLRPELADHFAELKCGHPELLQNHMDLFVELIGQDKESYKLRIRIELEGGWLVGAVNLFEEPSEDSKTRLSEKQIKVMDKVLVLFLRKCGIRLVRGKIEDLLSFYLREFKVSIPGASLDKMHAEYWIRREEILVELITDKGPPEPIVYQLDENGRLYEPAPLVALATGDPILPNSDRSRPNAG